MKLDVREPQQDLTLFDTPLYIQVPYTAENFAALQRIPDSCEVSVRTTPQAAPPSGILDKLLGLIGFTRKRNIPDEDLAPYYGYQITGNTQGGTIHLRLHHLPHIDSLTLPEAEHIIGMVHTPVPEMTSKAESEPVP